MEKNDLIAQVADRERQIELDFIDSYDEYTFDYSPRPETHISSGSGTDDPDRRPDTRGFADALAARLPDAWRARPLSWRNAEPLWDNGYVSWAAEAYVGDDRGASLHGPGGEEFMIINRPFRPDQFLIAAYMPEGFHPHHLQQVEEPHGIAVSDQPARAAARLTGRLLPRYHQALAAVEEHARADPIGIEPAPPSPLNPKLIMEWNARGELTFPTDQVPEPLRLALMIIGFHHKPAQHAYCLPARWGDRKTAYIQMVARELAEYGIGLTVRPARTTDARTMPTAASPVSSPRPCR